jgi:glycosyltransferase involved in cell wall biosynthesis
MKIIYVTTGLDTGGAEIMLYNLLSRINRGCFNPVVISLRDRGTVGDRIAALGVPVYALDLQQGIPTASAIWRLIRIVRQVKPDLVQGWMYHGNLAAQLVSIFCTQKPPVIWGVHCTIYSLALEKRLTATVIKLCSLLSKLPSKIVYVSQISRSQHEGLGYCEEKSYVISNGTDNLQFVPSSEARLSVRTELGLPEKSLLIGLICRYHPMKDHANFLQAAALLIKEYPDVNFLLVGKGVELENQILNEFIQKLGIVKQTHLLGERTDISRLTAALDIASSASAYGEGFPLIVGEAMSCGVPCVVTDVGDSGWIVDKTGRVVPPRNAQALANAWKELISLGSEGREALGKAAHARVSEHFSLDSIVAQYEKLYESVLKQTLTEKG